MSEATGHPDIERWVRSEIRALSAYQVPASGSLVKLDAMENPYHLPAAARDEWLNRLRDIDLNRYPDASSEKVKAALREHFDIPNKLAIMLGNGSDELIQIIAMSLARPTAILLAPTPSFVMYRMIAAFTGMRYKEVALDSGFDLDMTAMREDIQRYQPAIIFLAYPNNPTGNLWQREYIEEIIQLTPGIVIVDEAYAPFASDSLLDSVQDHPNLLLMRTFSKMGLAGLRLGWLMGAPEWLAEFEKVRLPYNINALTQASIEFALGNAHVFDQQSMEIRHDRQLLYEALNGVKDIEVYPSEANFILFRVQNGCGTTVFDNLKQRGVLIKNLSGQLSLKDCLRVTVGAPAENEQFVSALRESL